MGTLRFAVLLAAMLGLMPVVPATAQEFVRIGNRLTAGQFLHIERGPIQSGAIQPTWWSAQWRLEPSAGGAVRIRNRWKNEYLHVARGETEWMVEPIEYLHLERGILQTGAMRADSSSSHWLISAQWPVVVAVPTAAEPPQAPPPQPPASPPSRPAPVPERWHGPAPNR